MKTINKKLAKARQDAGLSQTKLGTLLGVSKQYINNIESGRRNPSDEQATNWADFCGYDLIIRKEIRAKLPEPKQEGWYWVRPLDEPEFKKMFWIEDFAFVPEIKDFYQASEELNTWQIEEWKAL